MFIKNIDAASMELITEKKSIPSATPKKKQENVLSFKRLDRKVTQYQGNVHYLQNKVLLLPHKK